jgi:YebC/PmpR family DNA-binding regulatory protein
MAGHNKWSKIKHRKAAVEKKKTKIWSKVSKAIMVAARHGGPDPDSNLSLRYAIDEARYANMPRDTIERAIKKGAGEKDGEDWIEVRYEGYGPGGVAVVVEALTNNRTRTVNEVRLEFDNYGGNMGAAGCVAFLFEQKGQIVIAAQDVNAEKLMNLAIESGASDIEEPASDEDAWLLYSAPTDYITLKDAIEKAGFKIEDAGIAWIPTTRTAVSGQVAKDNSDLVEALEDLDDVQKVWTNADFPDT